MQNDADYVAVNENGLLIGESHPRAVLTDHEVDLVLALNADGLSYRAIADKMDVSKGCVAKICSGQRRGQVGVKRRRARAKRNRR